MFEVVIEKSNGATTTVSTNNYSYAIMQYRDAIKQPRNHACRLIQDGFVLDSTDPLDHIFPIPGQTCVGAKLRHTDRGVRAFVTRFVWDEPDDDLGIPGFHVAQTITDYDAATMRDFAVQHAKIIAKADGIPYVG